MLDSVFLNRVLAFPLFLGVMYLMFMFTINIGSAFIDFFDLSGMALFVEGPRQIYAWLGLPVVVAVRFSPTASAAAYGWCRRSFR